MRSQLVGGKGPDETTNLKALPKVVGRPRYNSRTFRSLEEELEDEQRERPWWDRSGSYVFLAYICTFTSVMNFAMLSPFFPGVAEDIGLQAIMVSVIFSLVPAGNFIFSFLACAHAAAPSAGPQRQAARVDRTAATCQQHGHTPARTRPRTSRPTRAHTPSTALFRSPPVPSHRSLRRVAQADPHPAALEHRCAALRALLPGARDRPLRRHLAAPVQGDVRRVGVRHPLRARRRVGAGGGRGRLAAVARRQLEERARRRRRPQRLPRPRRARGAHHRRAALSERRLRDALPLHVARNLPRRRVHTLHHAAAVDRRNRGRDAA
eukprot:4156570-Prymnesium_polylepis.1